MTHRSEIRFLLNGRTVNLPTVPATQTLLDFLRLDRRLTGTKVGEAASQRHLEQDVTRFCCTGRSEATQAVRACAHSHAGTAASAREPREDRAGSRLECVGVGEQEHDARGRSHGGRASTLRVRTHGRAPREARDDGQY